MESAKPEELVGSEGEGFTNWVNIHAEVPALNGICQPCMAKSEDEEEKEISFAVCERSLDSAENGEGNNKSVVCWSSGDCVKVEDGEGAGTADCLDPLKQETVVEERLSLQGPQDSVQSFKTEDQVGLAAKCHQECIDSEKSDRGEDHTARDCEDSMVRVNTEQVETSFSDGEGCIIQVKVEEEEEFRSADCWGSVDRVKADEGCTTIGIDGQYAVDQEAGGKKEESMDAGWFTSTDGENRSVAESEKLNLIPRRWDIMRKIIFPSRDEDQSTRAVPPPVHSHSDLNMQSRVHMVEKAFKCAECNKSFSHAPSLYRHIRMHVGEKPYSCPECKLCFSHFSHLIVHRRLHTGENPYKCRKCSKDFSHTSSLYRHMRIHSGEKPHICTECKKCFRHYADLIIHQRLHTGESPFACRECEKTFIWPSALVVHQRGHTVERPYECSDCKKSFSRSTDLTIHRRVHTGENPYECPECKKRFRYSSSLGKHLIIHTGEKPYECSVCMKSFRQSSQLIRHQKIHTWEAPFECKESEELHWGEAV